MTVRTQRKKEHRRVAIALAASLLIHFLILLVFVAYLLWFKPAWKPPVPSKPEPEPVELTIIPPPDAPKPTPPKEFFDSAQGQVSEKAPEHAAFESDQNTIAASERPAQSDRPVPTVEGEKSSELTLQAQNLSLGPAKQPAPPAPASVAREPQPPAKEKEKPQPTPPEKDVAKTTPTPKPKPTPRPEDAELAMLDPKQPKPTPPKPEEPVKKPERPSPPSKPRPPGFQPQTRVTRLTGGISNRGRASMDSVATPLGRYKKQMSDAIGSRWYYYIQEVLDLVNVGTVQLRFVVRADGKVEGVKVLSNSSNESLASCSVRAIIEAEIPPIPKDVASVLNGSKIEVDYSFTIIGQ